MISGVLASIGGMLLAARLGRGDIASGNNLLLDSVAAALIGFAVLGAAKPNAFGTAMGALFVGILLQGLTMMNAPYYTQDFVKGWCLWSRLCSPLPCRHAQAPGATNGSVFARVIKKRRKKGMKLQ
jgi:simple sugar transport system permease protein